MHTWVPDTRKPSLAAHGGDTRRLAATVHGTLMVVSMGSEQLSEWSAIVVSRHLKRLGLPGGTPVSRYLAAHAEDTERPTRWGLFAEMCEFIRLKRSDPGVARGRNAARRRQSP
jgi:hypothetical protein